MRKQSVIFKDNRDNRDNFYVLVLFSIKLHKCHVYNLQVLVFWLASMLCNGCKNVKTGAFLPRFCINIQNDRKIANKALFFHNAQDFS